MNTAYAPATDTLLEFDSDVGTRRRFFVEPSFSHPAKLHLGLLAWIVERFTKPGDTVLDPMAGVGSLLLAATLQRNVILREIEPRWLEIAHRNAAKVHQAAGLLAGAIDVGQHDARKPWNVRADHIIFSPPYGCQFGGKEQHRKGYLDHKLRKAMEAGTKHADLWARAASGSATGRAGALTLNYGQHPAQIGHLRDSAYWQAMRDIYANARESLCGGYMILVIKDHIRRGERVRVADTTIELCEGLGFELVERHARRVHPLSLWQRRRKEQGKPIVEDEDVLVFVGCGQGGRHVS